MVDTEYQASGNSNDDDYSHGSTAARWKITKCMWNPSTTIWWVLVVPTLMIRFLDGGRSQCQLTIFGAPDGTWWKGRTHIDNSASLISSPSTPSFTSTMPSYLTTHEWETIIGAISDTYPIADATPDDHHTLYTLFKAAKKSINTAMTALSQQTSSTRTTQITKLLTNIAQKYDGLDDDDMNEDSFIRNRVDPSFFKNERTSLSVGA
ncbi:unnamed protein product [Absidia cylindrospora]